MNNKMTTKSQLSTTEPKKQKQTKQTARTGTEMEITWRVIIREGEEGEWGKGTGNKKHKWQVQNRQGEGKNSKGKGEAKDSYV